MTLTKREIFLVIILVMSSSLYVYYEYLYSRLEERTRAIILENEKMEQSILCEEALTAKQKEVLESSAARRESYQQLLWKVPEEPCLPEIIDYFSRASRQSSVKATKFSYKYGAAKSGPREYSGRMASTEKSQAADYDLLQLELEAEGEYANLISLVLQLENAPRLFQLNNLVIESKPDSRRPNVNNVNIERQQQSTDASGKETGVLNYDQEIPPNQQILDSESGKTNLLLKLKFTAFFDQSTAGSLSGMDSNLLIVKQD